jgi:hypothetical protein
MAGPPITTRGRTSVRGKVSHTSGINKHGEPEQQLDRSGMESMVEISRRLLVGYNGLHFSRDVVDSGYRFELHEGRTTCYLIRLIRDGCRVYRWKRLSFLEACVFANCTRGDDCIRVAS